MKEIDFDDEQWEADEAIAKLFFSRMRVNWGSRDRLNALKGIVQRNIEGGRYGGENGLFTADQRKCIDPVVQQLADQFSESDLRGTATPLVWLRFAFQAMVRGIDLSENFLMAYARWRETRVKEHGVERIRVNASAGKVLKSKPPDSGGNRKNEPYTLDRFLLDKKLKVSPGTADSWEIRWVQSKSARASLNAKDNGVAARPPKSKGSRTIQEIVGSGVYNSIDRCVKAAALDQKMACVRTQKKAGRYVSDLSRAELVKLLQKRYKDLKDYRPSTISRALPEFVACPNYRRTRTKTARSLSSTGK